MQLHIFAVLAVVKGQIDFLENEKPLPLLQHDIVCQDKDLRIAQIKSNEIRVEMKS